MNKAWLILPLLSFAINKDGSREITFGWFTLSQSDMLILSSIRATGYAIGGGDDETAGATVIAKRKLASGKVLNLTAPFTRFEGENGYKYAGKLAEDIEMVAQEAILYLQGKHAPDLQLEMEFKTTKPNE